MSVTISNSNITIVEGKVRTCGVCHTPGHDKRTCPSFPKASNTAAAPAVDKAAVQANHCRHMSHVESGPARLTDPAKRWAELGPDAGTYPFERDAKGCLHMPAILLGSYTHAKAIQALPEYTFDSEEKLYHRIGPCPGCA
jgi:hypothetical protein